MQITDGNYNISNTNNNSITNNNSLLNQNVTGNQPLSGNAQITQVPEGQLFHGQILNVTREQVSILLDNNSTLLARLGDAVNLNIGDNITFQIKENNGDNVVIRPFLESAATVKDNAIFKVLDTNNFAPTEKNYQIAETLMNNNMPVDKASMQRIMQQAYKFPDTSVDTMVAMNKLGIPVNAETIGQYEAFLSNNHQMVNNLNDLSGSVSDFLAQMVSDISMKGEESSAINSEILDFNTTLLESISDESDMANPEILLANNTDGMADGGNNISDGIALRGSVAETANQIEQPEQNYKGIAELSQKFNINEEGLKEILNSLEKSGINKESLNKAVSNSDTPLKLLNNINELLKENPEANIDLKAFFQSEGYKELLQQGIKHKFTLDPGNMKNPKEIDEIYNKLYEKTNNLMEAFSGKGGNAGQELTNSAKSIQERLDFMQNLNNMFTYAQIPVRTSSNEMNSELFVYLNKRKNQEKKEDISALLHLDMDHLGPTDVHVSLRGNMVHTKFYVEDEISAKILDEHMTMLEKAVNENGFSLTNEVITREPTLNTSGNMVVDEMLGNDLEKSVKRYSFDVRT